MQRAYYFEITTPLGIIVHTTQSYWKIIVTIKHPSVSGKETKVKETLQSPDEIRNSQQDPNVLLFYKALRNRFLCVVVKQEEKAGFILTAYFTEKIKEGKQIWKK